MSSESEGIEATESPVDEKGIPSQAQDIPESEQGEKPEQSSKKLFLPSTKNLQEQDISLAIKAVFSKKVDHVVLPDEDNKALLQSKGFGTKETSTYFLKDYEVLYLMYSGKLTLKKNDKDVDFNTYVSFALKRDENAWTRFLIFRDLRSRGYVVREGFGFPIDFRVYDRGDYGLKAAKYIVFGMNEGKTMSVGELKKHIEEMSTMGKEAVIAVVERRGEVIYYKVDKWRPIKPLSAQQ